MNEATIELIKMLKGFFSSIPYGKWCKDTLADEKGKKSALGFLGYVGQDDIPEPAQKLLDLCEQFDVNIADVEDGYDDRFKQGHQKTRVLAMFDYMLESH